ncbi:hypothetical protein NE236_31105 [Actinoallomurus purpureus]|uniref:hypothetical protein n=1 Tax=Actinoallomurus purpureus TaxID=478114 RepID=UPI0020932A0C|nr:hypothetical protein [Actinoallomurus purpureus]MCO6009429.1 hypothetical protein [Actinoallomurus purpureus]
MTSRFAAVLAGTDMAAPPGTDPDDYRLALLEDTYEVVAGLEFVTPVLALTAPDPAAEAVTWPGTPIVRAAGLDALLPALHDLGAEQAAVVAPDAPDLPALLLGKLFRALGSGQVAVCPAAGGGLVALAARLPAPPWLAGIGLDTSDAPARLRAAAGTPGAVRSAPGWHRLRTPADVSLLDPGLEGWDNTRALLAGH